LFCFFLSLQCVPTNSQPRLCEGGKDEVRELAEDKYCTVTAPTLCSFFFSLLKRAHLFLEKRGETLTVKELRDR
jgi:hypothetical protein